MDTYTLLKLTLCIAVVAYVYSQVLTQPDMLLNPLYNWIDSLIGPYGKRPTNWLFKPLIGCYTCVAGQIALWFYLIVAYNNYSLVQHIAFVSLAIYFTSPVNKIYTWKN